MAKKKNFTESEILATIAVQGVQEKKAKNVVMLNMGEIPGSIFDYFIVCHGTSPAQTEAIADSVYMEIKKATGMNPWKTEGRSNAEWIILDYVNIVVHIFLRESRDYYKLENMWADAEKTSFPDVE